MHYSHTIVQPITEVCVTYAFQCFLFHSAGPVPLKKTTINEIHAKNL